jgi:hypothetical protein
MSGRGTNKGKNKGQGRWQREDIEWGIELAGYYDVGIDDDDQWEEDDDSEADGLRGELLIQLRSAVPIGAKHHDVVPDSHESDLTALLEKAEQLAKEIETADLETLHGLGETVTEIESALSEITQKVTGRKDDKTRITNEVDEIGAPDGAEDTEIESLQAKKQLVTDAFSEPALTDDAIGKARNAHEDVRKEAQRIGEQVEVRRVENGRIGTEGDNVKEDGHLDDQKVRMETARTNLKEALLPPITAKRNEDAAKLLQKLMDEALAVSQELQGLGGVDGIGALCKAAGVDPTAYAELEKGLGGRAATAEILKTIPPTELGQLCVSFGGGTAGATQLGTLIPGFGGVAPMKETMASLGGADKLTALVTKGKVDGASAKKLCDDLGGPFVAALMGTGNDPTSALALHTELGTNVKQLQDLTKEGGFDGKPEALAALFTKGCKGDAKQFATLCADFDNTDDRAKLKGLIVDGGLGDAPDALGELLATGCDGKSASLKQFGTSFGDKDTRDGPTAV